MGSSSDFGQRGVGPDVQIGRRGPRYKNVGGVVQIRNAADTAFVRVQGADSVADDDLVTRRQLLASAALAGLPGVIYESLQFYMDPSDRNSYPASGTTVTDIMGNATGGTLTNVAFEDGAFEYDGSAAAPGSASFTKGTPLNNVFSGGGTVIAFVRAADDGQANLGVVGDTSNDTDAGWTMHTTGKASGHIGVRFVRHFDASSGGIWTADLVTNPINNQSERVLHAGVWSSWTVAYDDGDVANDPTFYINATTVSLTENTPPVGSAISDAGNPLRFGSTVNVSNPWTFDGQMGPILIFDRILDPDEIAAVHNVFAQRFAVGWRGMDGKLLGSDTQTDMSGQDVRIRGGDSHSTTNSEAEGGHVYIQAGNHKGGGNAAAGRILMRSGDGGGNVSDSAEILIESGSSGLGAAVTIRVGVQNTGNTPGLMSVIGADNDGSGGSGQVFIRGGSAVGSGRAGGKVTVRAGEATDNDPAVPPRALNGPGGDAEFRAGDGNQNSGGLGNGGDTLVRAGHGGIAGGQGGDLDLFAGNSNTGNSRGGHVQLLAGGAAGAFQAGDVTISAGSNTGGGGSGNAGSLTLAAGASNDGDGGKVTISGGNTSSDDNGDPAGDVEITAGSALTGGADTTSGGGHVRVTAGNSAKTSTASPAGNVELLAGTGNADSANSRGGKVTITGGPVTGNTAGAIAGDVEITGGAATSATAATTAGWVRLRGGTSTTGTHGGISAVTDDATAPVQIRTQAGFAGTDEVHLTVGVNTTLTPGGTVDLLTLGTLATNGHNMKFQVEVTGVDSGSVDDQNQQVWIQSYHRNSTGTIAAYTADLSPGKHIATISGFSVDVDYSLVVVGNNIILRATNSSSTATYVGLFAVKCVRQEGGFSS